MIDDKALRLVLQTKIAQINTYPKSAFHEVREKLADKYNVNYGVSTDIFNGVIPMETLNYDMLFKLAVCIKETNLDRWGQLDASGLHLQKYFTEREIIDYDTPYFDKSGDKDLVVDNWLQVNPDQYVCVLPVEQLIEWRNMNKIRYNPRTQRRLTEKVNKGIVIKVVTIFQEALDSIRELMKNNEFISDDISFNIDPTYNEPPKVLRGKLIIPKESLIDIIDGFHRLKEMLERKDFNSDWEYNCIVNIMVFDEEKAIRYILQKDKKNHLSEEQIEQMDQSSEINFLINKLNESNRFHLKGTIDSRRFDVIRKVLDKLFNLDGKSNRKISFREKRARTMEVYNHIEQSINDLVEKYNMFEIEFSLNMWFVALCIVHEAIEKDVNFNAIIDKIDFNNVVNQIQFKNYPTVNNYRYVREVISNVL